MDLEAQGRQDDDPRSSSEDLVRGAIVGRYLIVGLLGKGGMGEVYAAYDPELDRKIALKLLRPHATAGVDPSEGRARLLREAQAIARLSDPNVVVVYDVGTFGDRVFLAMEFIDGTTLGYWVHARVRSWREVVTTFIAAGRGLACAHRGGVVHRDFKPDNVMIDREGKVRVMDFGLARAIDTAPPDGRRRESTKMRTVFGDGAVAASVAGGSPPRLASGRTIPGSITTALMKSPVSRVRVSSGAGNADAEDQLVTRDLTTVAVAPQNPSSSSLASSLTLTGAMMGTPAYMAPEQFRGVSIDARTDQFSFCVALYEALYGERPFESKNLHELTANVLKGKIKAPPAHARVPGWLRRCLLRGLRVDPEQRYQSMEILLTALARDPARSQRRWAGSGAVAALVVVLVAGLVRANRHQRSRCLGSEAKLNGIWELPSGQALSPTKESIRRTFMATGKRYAADSFAIVRNALDRYVTEWNDMHRDSCEATNVRGEQSADVLDLRARCLQDRFLEVRALANVFRDASGDVVSKSVAATQSLRPIEQCADIVALRAVVRPPDDPRIRRTVGELRAKLADVKALANAGKYRKAMDQIGPIVSSARAIDYAPVTGEALLQLANIQGVVDDIRGAEKNYEEAIWAGEVSRHDEVVLEAAAQLVWAVGYRQRRYQDGERWARYSGAVLRRLGPGHEVIAGWRANNLGLMYTGQGRFQDAVVSATEAVNLKTKALGPEHYDVAISQSNLAQSLAKAGRMEEAVQIGQQALEVLRRSVGPDHPRFAEALIGQAEFMNALGRYAEGQAMAEQSLAVWKHEIDPNNPIIAYCLNALGESLIGSGSPAVAIPHLERALSIREAKDPLPELLGETRFALARSLSQSNRTPHRALQLAEQARADYRQDPNAKDQVLAISRWVDAHSPGAQHVSMR